MPEKREFQARTERIEELVRILEGAEDPKIHAVALELMQSVMELHGVGLEKMLELVAQNSGGEHLIDEFAQDDLISSLLLLHDLHPDDIETRVLRALDRLRPNLQSQGGDAELLGIEDGLIRLRIHGMSGGGCHSSSAATLKSEVEDAIYQAAPDAIQIMTEEVEHPRPAQLVTLK
ncbi:MAG: NifU-like domain protein [Acidobacteriaceae bacterium]|jgi:Fe-S cluster biogenesis protein NfuA|nr:NifU-like domain protein [Acidobacteriaceae bacterium]